MRSLIGYQIDSDVVNVTTALVGAYVRTKKAGINADFWRYFGKQQEMDDAVINIEYKEFDFDSYVTVARYLKDLGVFENTGDKQG